MYPNLKRFEHCIVYYKLKFLEFFVTKFLCAWFSAWKKVQQQSEFVTSDYRAQVLQALELRNRYAQRPFVCRQLLKENVVVSECTRSSVSFTAFS